MGSRLVQNILLFQLGWFACVLAGASDHPWVGTITACVIVVLHLLRSYIPVDELKLVLCVTFIGVTWDSILTMAMLMRFDSGILVDGMVPHWLIAMWALFATTLNVSLRWLRSSYMLTAVIGLIGGPAAYYAGHRLGAVTFSDTPVTLLVIGVGWMVILPILVHLSTCMDGYPRRNREAVV